MNLAMMDTRRNVKSFSIKTVIESESVAKTITANPNRIEYFLPTFSSMWPTIGEKRRAATSKDLSINVMTDVHLRHNEGNF